MDPHTLKKLNEARIARKAAVMITHLGDGRDRLVLESDQVKGDLGTHVEKAFLSGKSSAQEIGDERFFINVHLPPPRIVVIGAVHISQALATLAKTAGYALEVIDPRTAFATVERFGETELFAEWPDEVLKSRPLDAYCALAAVTHDPKIDDYPLEAALEAGCFYVGALGSRKTHAKRMARLIENGVSQEKLDRVHSPIGLDIGAASPQEIAVAIMAEIISAFRNRGLEHQS
ncbi:MAG: XdhC family protein [Pseudomonadota bacterium]